MSILPFAIGFGILAGLRAFTPLAAIAWAAHLGVLRLGGTPLAFLGSTVTPWIASALALVELATDKLSFTPSRKAPPLLIARVVSGGFTGASLGFAHRALALGIACGVVGAIIGTFGGAAARGALARAFGKDLPAALLEDAIAVGGSALLVSQLS